MAKKKIHVELGKRKLEISNLQKVLYPDDNIVKAEIIQYYLNMAPVIVRHLKGRPLSLVRFPDGIYGEQFFQKNRPDWTPDWIDYVRLGQERKKEYVVANEGATLVWLANLACLELHQMHCISHNTSAPDYIVYDLDPPEGYDYQKLKGIAFHLKEHLERFGYHVFLKTTGGKGLHLVTPIATAYTFDQSFQTAKVLASSFLERNKEVTLSIKKDGRHGKVLIDIYRNRPSQTIIGSYSLRGKEKATVSSPISWEKLDTIESNLELNIYTVPGMVEEEGDAWESIRAWAIALHTDKKSTIRKEHGPNDKRKSEDQLQEYQSKRDFNKTSEPDIVPDDGAGNRYVVQRHHASHLHYDLRLEQEGTLKSWALPRGLPPSPGVKRLAVQTEDHPLKYLSFEGEIPKGEYGGGMMWVYNSGRYEITKEKKNGFYFRLASKTHSAEYRMHLMKGKEWLLERVDEPLVDFLEKPVKPMLADAAKKPPIGDYLYEVKWDGIRVIITLNEGKLTIRSRNLNDVTEQFPELNVPEEAFRINNAVFDGEIVCLDEVGKADFKKVIKRLMTKNARDFSSLSRRNPAYCYLFDCLYMDGKVLTNEPFDRRREWLEDSVRKETNFRISEVVRDGEALFDAAKKLGVEGIMAKDISGKYYVGKRSESWIKVKVKETRDFHILGYSKGEGERSSSFGSLQLGEKTGDEFIYRGRVGTGFDQTLLNFIADAMKSLDEVQKQFDTAAHEEKSTTWIDPVLIAEVEFSMITDNGTLRDPVFKKLVE